MARKSEGLKYVERWRNEIVKEESSKIDPSHITQICIRSDNDSVFTSNAFKEYCHTSGITLQTSVANETHAYRAENAIGRVRAMTRSMLPKSPGPTMKFWSDAMTSAAHVINRTPLQDRPSPMEIWSGLKASAGRLRSHGSPCAVHLPRTQ